MVEVAELASVGPINLDQLTRRAELLTRVDRKYIVALPELGAVIDALAPQARALSIDGRREFGYQTVYFDTPDLRCYLDAAHRRQVRFKVRTRSYTEQGLRYLEVKTRQPQGSTAKFRRPYGADPYTIEPEPALLDLFAAAGIAAEPYEFGLTMVVNFRRSTLCLTTSNSRLTIDTGLSCTLPDGSATAFLPGHAIVETKSAVGASAADRVLWTCGRHPVDFSKFGTGLAALRPGLPAGRWHSILGKYLQVRHPPTG